MKSNFYQATNKTVNSSSVVPGFKLLHEKALETAKNYLKAESDLIEILQAVDDCRGYRTLGHRSLFEYVTVTLKLSENVAYNLITVSRKSNEVPALQEKIKAKEITLSSAKVIASVLTPANQEKWLVAASTLSKRELEKEIVKELPELKIKEREKQVSANCVELRLGISEKLHRKLKRVQDLVSTRKKKPANLEETLEVLLELYLEKEDPVRKAERVKEKQIKKESEIEIKNLIQPENQDRARCPAVNRAKDKPVTAQSSLPVKNSRYIPAKLKHEITLRDQARCTHETGGKRCEEKRWLDIHHILPVTRGGKHTRDNLTTLCKGHHLMLHFMEEIRET